MLGGGAGAGGAGGSGAGAAVLGLDLLAVIQVVCVGVVLFSVAVIVVRCAASRYFVVDAAGFAASYDDHHHHSSPHYHPMSSKGNQHEQGGAAADLTGPCAACGAVTSKKCSQCKRVRYCSQECQSRHWKINHKFKCKQMKSLDPADKLSCGGEANNKKSSGFGRISLVPSCKKISKGQVLFPYDEFLKLYNWKDFDVIPCGLMNCGNSCFANVVLQCLSCTRPLVAYLLGKDHSRECSMRHEDWCFLCELQCHIHRASGSLHPFAPTNILSHLPNIGGNLGFGRQEDAHEFMRFAIDKMQSACLDEYGGEKAVDLSTQETTIIQHIFGGRLQSQVQCTACGVVSNRYDNMMDLTVEIQGDAESLEKCLDQFTAIEWLDGDNKYKCDGCNDYVKARKHLSVHQAPNILTITLKRFQSGRFGKLNKRITFPMELDLTSYTSDTDGSDLYDLYAVVVHLDMLNASFFGHYICYIKGYQGRWYKIDDCKVMVVDEEEVHAQGAYMLLYSRKTARPRLLVTVDESMKQQQQCKLLPSNGQSHMILADATLNCASSLKTSEDLLQQDCESNNESLHEMDIKDQESDLDLCTSIEEDKIICNENLHIPGSPVSPDSVLEGSVQLGPPLEGGPTTMSSLQFGNSTSDASSEHSFAEQCEVPASCIDSVDYMDVDTEACTEVDRWAKQRPVLDDSVGRPHNNTSIPIVNGMSRECKPSFSSGFCDKPSRKRSSFAEEDSACSPPKLNGYCNGHLSSLEQGVANSRVDSPSSGDEKCNGDTPMAYCNDNLNAVNGDIQSSNGSLHADKRDVPFISHGFEPRPYKVPSDSNNNCSRTSNGKPKACQGDMSFLSRGFLGRPSSRGISVKADDGLPFSNGTSSSFGNGNIKSSNNKSSIGGLSPGFLTRHRRESSGTSSDISMDKKSNGAAAVPDHAEERVSDCTPNGSSFQIRAASDHLDENGLAILSTKNNSCGQENGSKGTPGMNHDGSEHGGLRRRITSKYFEQDGIDAQ